MNEMRLSDQERRFLAKRAKFVRLWPYTGAMLLATIAGLGLWLFLYVPLLANPWAVLTRLEHHAIEESTLVLMAVILPVVVLICLGLVGTVVLFAFVAFSNEKKYLAIIRRMSGETDSA